MSKREKMIKEILDDIYAADIWVLEGIVEKVMKEYLPTLTDSELKEFTLSDYTCNPKIED